MFTKLFVGALPFRYSNEELQALFARAGTVVSAEMVFDPDRGRTRGFGFVEMRSPEEAQAAIAALNGFLVGEKKIHVSQARERSAPRSPKFGEPAKSFPRKAGRENRIRPPGPSGDAIDRTGRRDFAEGQPSWPPNRKYISGEYPTYPRPVSDRPARRYKGSRGRGPAQGPTPPGTSRSSGPAHRSFSPGGFSRPNKWEPRGDDKRSFSAPRDSKGNFRPGRSPASKRPGGSASKPKFWQKFAKKSPRRDAK